MARQFNPVNQRRHDNVARVQLSRRGTSFEIACYRNKAVSYRNGIEQDRDSVLQIERVFINVSFGKYANQSQLRAAFEDVVDPDKKLNATEFERLCVAYILDHGTMQVNKMERQQEEEMLLNDICQEIVECGIHPQTRRPYPISVIRDAVQEFGFKANPRKTAKPQAHELLRQLSESARLLIERAPMRLKAQLTERHLPIVEEHLSTINANVVQAERGLASPVIIFDMAPDHYRSVRDTILQGGPECSHQVLSRAVRVCDEDEALGTVVLDESAERPIHNDPVPDREGPYIRAELRKREQKGDGAQRQAPVEGGLGAELFAEGSQVELRVDEEEGREGQRGRVISTRPNTKEGLLVSVDFGDGKPVELPATDLAPVKLGQAGGEHEVEEGKKAKPRRKKMDEAALLDRQQRRRQAREELEREEYVEDEVVENRRVRDLKERIRKRDVRHILVDIDDDGVLSLQADDDIGDLREDLTLPDYEPVREALKKAFEEAGGNSDVFVLVRFTELPGGVEYAPPRVSALINEDGSAIVQEPDSDDEEEETKAPDGEGAPSSLPPPARKRKKGKKGGDEEEGSSSAAAAVQDPESLPDPGRRKKGKGKRRGNTTED